MNPVKASVIVLAWDGMEYLGACLPAVLCQEYPNFEVIVVDNGSTDGSADFVAAHYPQVRLIRNERNLGFAAGNNVGLRQAVGDVLVLLNQDTVVQPGWLAALMSAFEDSTVGIAGCKILYPDGRIQHAGACVHDARGYSHHYGWHQVDEGQFDECREVAFVTGAALAISRTTLDQVGELDEGFSPAYYEDTDWCYRCRASGFRVVYVPEAVLIHHESASLQSDSYDIQFAFHRGRLRFMLKHSPLRDLLNDFWAAELTWLSEMERSQELAVVRAVYLDALLRLSDVVALRPDRSRETTQQIAAMLLSLRRASGYIRVTAAGLTAPDTVSEQADVDRPQAERAFGSSHSQHLTQQQHLLEQLQNLWHLQEQPFHSDVPGLGPAIAAFRERFNQISTRWYVLPMLQQQNHFNAAVASFLSLVAAHQVDAMPDVAGSIWELTLLAERLMELERDLADWQADINERLAAMERQDQPTVDKSG